MTAAIHPTAVVEPGARIGQGVRIGPFCVVGPQVVLADGVELKSHVVVTGDTHVGQGSTIWPFAVIGEAPQDLKYAGEPTALRIGARNRIREHVTMHLGTAQGGGVTRIGNDGLYMAACHIAHDVTTGDRVVIANNVGIAGHCVVGDEVIIGGLAGVHQWVRIGRGAMIGGLARIVHDVLPFALVQGADSTLEGLNLIGLRRRGVSRDEIAALRAALVKLKSGDGSFMQRARDIDPGDHALVAELVEFVTGASDRHFMRPT